MKKNILLIIGCAIILSISSIAYSAEGVYVSANLGLALANDSDLSDSTGTGTMEFDPGISGGVAAGYDFGCPRIEGEIVYQRNNLDMMSVSVPGIGSGSLAVTGDVTSTAFLINGYYDFKNNSSVTPFIGGGFGMAKVEASAITVPGFGTISSSVDDTVFAYQVGAGLGFAVNEKLSIDLKYRFLGTSDPNFEGTTVTYSTNNFYAGLRVSF
jgi:opacity protein-like surface antigen